MKKRISILLLSALISLACLEVAAISTAAPGVIAGTAPTLTNAGTAATVATMATSTLTPALVICARVTADTAENLRSSAAASGPVRTWLKAGDVVTVINQLNADWWLVTFESHSGYARSSFLQLTACPKGK